MGHGNPEAYQCWELWADSCSVLWEREYLSPFLKKKKKKSITSQTQKQHRKCCWCSGKSHLSRNSCICFAQKPEEKKILIYISKSNWTLEMSEDKCLQKAAAFQQHSPSSMPTTMNTFTPATLTFCDLTALRLPVLKLKSDKSQPLLLTDCFPNTLC